MRKGSDALQELFSHELKKDPLSGHLLTDASGRDQSIGITTSFYTFLRQLVERGGGDP